MDNGVFIVLPELHDYDPRTVFQNHPDVVETINQQHFYNSQLIQFVDTLTQVDKVTERSLPTDTVARRAVDDENETPPQQKDQTYNPISRNLKLLYSYAIKTLQNKPIPKEFYMMRGLGIKKRQAPTQATVSLGNHRA
ncbi:unnamed protein product [Haemonchus placei]|uniref:Uncharacterized protein n=1 Tax=Haemonchus placei TaxID=6290 RepID=A0A0N4XBW1_HAEPC|nr:unnamed protein product [Haemonchus placei]